MKSAGDLLKNNSYKKLLDDDRWRRFAKARREEANNSCQVCKRGKLVLQVHHWFYDGRLPWEYEPSEVIVLCDPCHKEYHIQLNIFRNYVFSKMTPQVLKVLNGALAVAFDKYDPLVFVRAVAELVATPTMVQRYADAWDMDAEKINSNVT